MGTTDWQCDGRGCVEMDRTDSEAAPQGWLVVDLPSGVRHFCGGCADAIQRELKMRELIVVQVGPRHLSLARNTVEKIAASLSRVTT